MRISDWSSDVCSSDLTAVAAFGRRWAKIGGRARRSSWLPRILGECFLHVADRIGAEAVRPLGAFLTIKDDEYDGADKGNQAEQKPPSRPVGVGQSPHGTGQRRKQKREHRHQRSADAIGTESARRAPHRNTALHHTRTKTTK